MMQPRARALYTHLGLYIEPRALYTHCYGHALNLAMCDSVKGCKVGQ